MDWYQDENEGFSIASYSNLKKKKKTSIGVFAEITLFLSNILISLFWLGDVWMSPAHFLEAPPPKIEYSILYILIQYSLSLH